MKIKPFLLIIFLMVKPFSCLQKKPKPLKFYLVLTKLGWNGQECMNLWSTLLRNVTTTFESLCSTISWLLEDALFSQGLTRDSTKVFKDWFQETLTLL